MNGTNPIERMPTGTIIFVDDDADEHNFIKMALKSIGLNSKLLSFYNGDDAYKFLKDTSEEIFAIICDVKMPKVDGLELKRMIEMTPELKIKAIPFIFHSNAASPTEVRAAYSMNIQGYFQKGKSLDETKECIRSITSFWSKCLHPKDLSSS
jgi:CheY-like chemotaxis protein